MHLWNFEKILLWLLNFDLTRLLEDFLPVSWAHIQIFQKFILKKKSNIEIWCLRLSRIQKILTNLTAF